MKFEFSHARSLLSAFVGKHAAVRKNFKLRVGIAALGLGLLLPVSVMAADKKKPVPPPAITKLAWLAGSWRMEKNGRLVDEQWMAPAGGAMLGMDRTVMKGRAMEHEFLQIREGPGGTLFYIAQPTGQKEAAFQLASLTDTVVVFENTEHDFPQKISYALQPDGSMSTVLEGMGPDGQPKRTEYVFQRVNR
jgi:hypothetical protein